MAEKQEFPLSIVLRTVDKATAGIQRFNAKVDAAFKPYRTFSDQAKKLSENLGLPKVGAALSNVGSQVKSLALGFAAVGTAAALAGGSILKRWIDQGDQLGDTAERLGLTANALAQLRYAGERSGVEVEQLDGALEKFSKNLGEVRAKSGGLYKEMKAGFPTLAKQLAGTKNTEEAFNLMVDALSKVEDPAVRAALAQDVFGRSGVKLVAFLGKGAEGIAELRREFARLAGDQDKNAEAAGKADDAFKKLNAAFTGIKAKVGEKLFPIITEQILRLTDYLAANREKIGQWIKEFADNVPDMIKRAGELFDRFKAIWDAIGGAEGAFKIFAAIKLAPLVVSVVQLGVALGQAVAGMSAMVPAMGAAAAAMAPVLAALAGAGIGIYGGLKAAQYLGILDDDYNLKSRSGVVGDDGVFREGAADEYFKNRKSNSHVLVEFKNAPKGMRVTGEGRGEVNLDLLMGLAMGAP